MIPTVKRQAVEFCRSLASLSGHFIYKGPLAQALHNYGSREDVLSGSISLPHPCCSRAG